MLTLCYTRGTCALAAHILLEQAGAVYDTVSVDFANNAQQSDAYLRINPKGRVPALVTDQGILTETPAILFYICQTHAQAQLAPLDDAFLLAQAQSFNNYLCSSVHVAHAHGRRGARWADALASIDDMRNKLPQTMAAAFQLIEDHLLVGPWVLGARYSMCDPYLFTLAGWLKGDGVDIERFPKVAAHQKRMHEIEGVQKVLEAQRRP